MSHGTYTEEAPFTMTKRRLPEGKGYNAVPMPRGHKTLPWQGVLVRWAGMDPELKKQVKREERRQHAALPHEFFRFKRPRNEKAANEERRARSKAITAHNHKCTLMERKAKDGLLPKEGAINIITGKTYAPFTLQLGRVRNTGYSGPELRAISAAQTHDALLSNGLFKYLTGAIWDEVPVSS